MRVAPRWILWTGLAIASPALAGSKAPPIVDGDCGEYGALGARSETITDGVILYVHQDPHFVWLCYTLPEGSLGAFDLRIESESLAEPMNLHVSAQVGEWPADRPDLAPRDPRSSMWWNHRGWTANWITYDGLDESATPPRPRWRSDRAHELQLSRQRFGAGEWRLAFDIYRVRAADGTHSNLRYPDGDALYRIPAAPGHPGS